jgi:hypothetical protein
MSGECCVDVAVFIQFIDVLMTSESCELSQLCEEGLRITEGPKSCNADIITQQESRILYILISCHFIGV